MKFRSIIDIICSIFFLQEEKSADIKSTSLSSEIDPTTTTTSPRNPPTKN